MAYADDLDTAIAAAHRAALSYQSREDRGIYAAVAGDQALAKAALADVAAIMHSLNANPTTPAAVASVVVIVPGSAAVTAGAGASHTKQLSVNITDAAGVTRIRPVTWASSNAALATVSTTGLVTGVAAGSPTVTATSEGVASAAITVTVT